MLNSTENNMFTVEEIRQQQLNDAYRAAAGYRDAIKRIARSIIGTPALEPVKPANLIRVYFHPRNIYPTSK